MISNHLMWKIGRVNYIIQIVSPFIILSLIGYIAYLKKPQPQVLTVAPVLVVENGKAVRLACDVEDKSYKELAVNMAETLAQIIYSESSESVYNSKAALFGAKLENNSQPALEYHNLIMKNFQKAKAGETAQFIVDSNSIKSGNDSKDKSLYVVIISGTQIVKTTASTTSNQVTLSVIYKFNKNRGQDGEILSIQKFNPKFSF